MFATASAALSLAIGYFCGCFLTADVVMRRRTGKSVFTVGTGNPGMANVGAVLGSRAAAVVLAGDILKTIAAVALSAGACLLLAAPGGGAALQPLLGAPWSLGFPHSGTLTTLAAGLGAVVGHDFPFWHRFRGGKGVTATCAALILFSPLLGGIASLAGLVTVALTHKLDAGAFVIPAMFCIGAIVIGAPMLVVGYAVLVWALSVVVWLRGRTTAGAGAPSARH